MFCFISYIYIYIYIIFYVLFGFFCLCLSFVMLCSFFVVFEFCVVCGFCFSLFCLEVFVLCVWGFCFICVLLKVFLLSWFFCFVCVVLRFCSCWGHFCFVSFNFVLVVISIVLLCFVLFCCSPAVLKCTLDSSYNTSSPYGFKATIELQSVTVWSFLFLCKMLILYSNN